VSNAVSNDASNDDDDDWKNDLPDCSELNLQLFEELAQQLSVDYASRVNFSNKIYICKCIALNLPGVDVYDHYFLPFSTIFGEKNYVFL
jgi:hypothetical protein